MVARRRRLQAQHVRVNRIVRVETGIVVDVGGDRNRIVGNTFVGGRRPSIVLQGSSHNVVRDNRRLRRARASSLVEFSEARYDDGRRAVPRFNQLDGNRTRRSAC